MQKKKILHLITGLEVGGAETMLLKTLPQLQNDFDDRVCCIVGHGPMGEKLKAAGIPVFYLELRNIFDFNVILRFRKIVKEFAPDILVTYLIHADLFGRIFGRIFGVKKIVCSQRGALLQWEWLRFFDRVTKFLVTKYIVQTETAQKELMQKLHLPKEKFTIIPNAIDPSEYDFELDKDAKKKELGIDPDNLNIVCVSKLRRGKGHEYLLEAFEKVFQMNENVNLLLAGDGEKKSELTKQVENYKSKSNIYFLGNRNDVNEILKISDIFVLATEGEGMSNAIMSAMASGLPIITTNIEVNKELIQNNDTGILIPAQNTVAIEKYILLLIQDASLRKKLRTNANKTVIKNYNLKKIYNEFKSFYSKI